MRDPYENRIMVALLHERTMHAYLTLPLSEHTVQGVELDSASRTAFELAHVGVPVETSPASDLPLICKAASRTWPLLAVLALSASAPELPRVRTIGHVR